MRALNSEKKWVSEYEKSVTLIDDLEVLYDFFKEGDISETEVNDKYSEVLETIENLEFKNMLSDEGDSMSAVLQITAGAGGTESLSLIHI